MDFIGRKSGRILTLLFLALCLPILFLNNPYSFLDFNVAMYLKAGQLLLDGQHPYVNFFDIQPPLIMYLNVPIVWLANHIGVESYHVFYIAILSLILAGGRSLDKSLQRGEFARPWLGLCGYYFANVVVMLHSQFGEREHLFALTFVPYLALRAFPPKRLAWDDACIALALSVAALLKPNFVAPVILLEIYFFIRRMPMQKAIRNLLSVGPIAYFILLISMPHDSILAYLREVVPEEGTLFRGWGFNSAYWWPPPSSWDASPMWDGLFVGFHNLLPLMTLAFLMLGIFAWTRRNSWLARDFSVSLALAGLLFCLGTLVEGKGWAYHFIPAYSALIFAAFLTASGRRGVAAPRWAFIFPIWAVAIFLSCLTLFNPLFFNQGMRLSPDRIMAGLDVFAKPGEKVLALSPLPPLENYFLVKKVASVSPYLFYYPVMDYSASAARRKLVAQNQLPELADLAKGERIFVDRIGRTIRGTRPGILLFSNHYGNALNFIYDMDLYARKYWLKDELASLYQPIFKSRDMVIYMRRDLQPWAKEQVATHSQFLEKLANSSSEF